MTLVFPVGYRFPLFFELPTRRFCSHTALVPRLSHYSIPTVHSTCHTILDRPPRFTRASAATHDLPVLGNLEVGRAPRARVNMAPATNLLAARPASASQGTPENRSTALALRRSSSLGPPSAQITGVSRGNSTRPPQVQPRTPGTASASSRDCPPHLTPPPNPKPATSSLLKMSAKLDLPTLVGPITATSISVWLGGCEDAFEAFTALSGKVVADNVRILLAGLEMKDVDAATWWSENRAPLKALSSWADFTTRVQDRFVPANWKLDALEAFYSVRQNDTEDFLAFATRLQAARNKLTGAGSGYTISDSILKNHLLFCCNLRLRRRLLAIPALKYHDQKVDTLVSALANVWASMVEEGVVRRAPPPRPFSNTASAMLPTATSAAPATARPVTEAERALLRVNGGCFHCGLTPTSPGWYPHGSSNCNGNSERGIPPRKTSITSRPPAAPAHVGAILPADDEEVDQYLWSPGLINVMNSPTYSGILVDEVPDDSDDSF